MILFLVITKCPSAQFRFWLPDQNASHFTFIDKKNVALNKRMYAEI